MSAIRPDESVLTYHMRQITEAVEDRCISAYHESYAHMHPGATETVRRADADDFIRRVRLKRPQPEEVKPEPFSDAACGPRYAVKSEHG